MLSAVVIQDICCVHQARLIVVRADIVRCCFLTGWLLLRRRRLGQSLTQEGSSGQVRYGSLTSPKARDSVTSIRRGFAADLLYTTSRESPRQIEVLEIERKRLAYRRRSATYRRLAVSRGGEDKAWPFPRCSQTDGRDDAAADAASLPVPSTQPDDDFIS